MTEANLRILAGVLIRRSRINEIGGKALFLLGCECAYTNSIREWSPRIRNTVSFTSYRDPAGYGMYDYLNLICYCHVLSNELDSQFN